MKKLLCFALVLTMALTPLTAGAEGRDWSASAPAWAADAYDHLGENYAIADDSPVSGPIDRGHFLALLVKALRATVPPAQLNAVDLEPYYNYFVDNYLDYSMSMDMVYAAAYGITEGSLQGEFRYGSFTKTLTRQEAAKMVCSTLDFFTGQGNEVPAAGTPAAYADAASIAAWAAPFTGRIAAYQLMQGDQNGNFNPSGALDWPSAVVLVSRTLTLMETALNGAQAGVPLHSRLDWAEALNVPDYQVGKPLTGYALGYYAIDNGDGTLSGLMIPPTRFSYATGQRQEITPTEFFVESYDAQGNVVDSKSLPMELPIWGGFLDGGDYFYLAFGQANPDQTDGREVYRIVQYDRDWNRIAAASVNGGESYTCLPYEAAVSRMALSPDGKTLALHAARERYASDDGVHHQSNITITVSTDGMKVRSVSEPFPDNHVSHSFGQFVQYDGSRLVTVDHGDAYPRSFLLQSGSEKQTLLSLYGPTGENRTHAIGSGLEVSADGYLFLGCSARQSQYTDDSTPWNVFLTYTGRNGSSNDSFTWLTQGETDIRCARLVKLSDSDFVALWGVDGDVRYQRLDGKGKPVGEEEVLEGAAMPTTQPVVRDGVIRWIGVYEARTNYGTPQPALFELEP